MSKTKEKEEKVLKKKQFFFCMQNYTWFLWRRLPFTAGRKGFGPAVGRNSVMIGHKFLGQISEQGQTLLTDGVPVMGVTTWEETKIKYV